MRKITLFIIGAVLFLSMAAAVYAGYERVVSLPRGGSVWTECAGGDEMPKVIGADNNRLLILCPPK